VIYVETEERRQQLAPTLGRRSDLLKVSPSSQVPT
jgi:hypothetical protein